LIDKVKKVAVIDHHRRKQDFTFNPVLVYIETSASSCSELCSELLAYQAKEVKIDSDEATLILTGIVIDTNGFKNRTGSRTFEVASLLKQYGADPARADEFLKDDYDTFSKKTKILKNMNLDKHGIAIACLEDTEIASRSILSQTADTMLSIKHVEASFVLARIDDKMVAISARSNGLINVHAIIEKMSGGGHFSAAGLQREGNSVSDLLSELNDKIALYFIQEGVNNENNPVG
jgi:c-di-AMP phosphodiesterase-like protein